jgi:hypothetical protein
MEKATRRTEAILRAAEARRRPGKERKIKIVPEFETYARKIGDGSITDGLSRIWEKIQELEAINSNFLQLRSVDDGSVNISKALEGNDQHFNKPTRAIPSTDPNAISQVLP